MALSGRARSEGHLISSADDTHHAAADRDQAADDRDLRAVAHDRESEARDGRADARDQRSETRERQTGGINVAAAADRTAAQRDRRGGSSDRAQAGDDRAASLSDRHLAAIEREISSIDGLTGAYRRDSGLFELRRELERARRTAQPFTLAFVDVDGLKTTNDRLGHAAGDDLLRRVATTMRSHIRPYDLIVRLGGDEFLCGLPNLAPSAAAQRFELVNLQLGQSAPPESISVGLAELEGDEGLPNLIERADQTMYEIRSRRLT